MTTVRTSSLPTGGPALTIQVTPNAPVGAAPYDPCWLGKAFLEDGLLTEEQLKSAISWFRSGNSSFEQTLETLSLVDQHTIARQIAKHYNLPHIELVNGSVPASTLSLLPAHRARSVAAVPISHDTTTVRIAVADPHRYGLREAARDFPGLTPSFVVSARNDILCLLELAGAPAVTAETTPRDRLQAILFEAIRQGVSDVHFESLPNALAVRFRSDGYMTLHAHFPPTMKGLLIQAAKTFAGIDTTEKRTPQDGHGKLTVGSRNYTFRLNTAPCYQGENAVIRIQSEGTRIMSLPELGLSAHNIATFQEILWRPYGVLYITGRTGSGKTTLLYSLLATQKTDEEKIITIENPIEIVVPSYEQQQVEESIGRTYPVLMRAVVRRDPDRILLGETRDLESAKYVVQSALTGHKVYSTLHTNDAASVIPRLVELGIEPYLIASCLSGVASCQLVRRLCRQCRQPVTGDRRDALFKEYGEGDYHVASPGGCSHCKNGYKGRIALAEVYPTWQDEIQSLILKRTPIHELRREFARILPQPDLRNDALSKARSGITSLEEALKEI